MLISLMNACPFLNGYGTLRKVSVGGPSMLNFATCSVGEGGGLVGFTQPLRWASRSSLAGRENENGWSVSEGSMVASSVKDDVTILIAFWRTCSVIGNMDHWWSTWPSIVALSKPFRSGRYFTPGKYQDISMSIHPENSKIMRVWISMTCFLSIKNQLPAESVTV